MYNKSSTMSKFKAICRRVVHHPSLKFNLNQQSYTAKFTQSSLNLHTIAKSSSIKSNKNLEHLFLKNDRNNSRVRAYSSYMTEDDTKIKKYKEVIKNYSFQVPSFGGKVSASSPVDITVNILFLK